MPPDEPAILPPLPILTAPKPEKQRGAYGTPQSRRFSYRDREWDRERDKDSELMPPPGSHKKEFPVPVDTDQPIDPNEPIYCVCHQVCVIKLNNEFFGFLTILLQMHIMLIKKFKRYMFKIAGFIWRYDSL